MPLVTIYTSGAAKDSISLMDQVTTLAAEELNKPESVVMVRVQDNAMIAFGGDSMIPSALFEIEGIELPAEAAAPLTEKLCQIAEEILSVPSDRVFVKLTNVPRGMWGGNGKVY